uniref:WASP like actin nucleation promoting factor b n=1 Tax=Takifugu rubripes TaxID=31033 RepID=A0A3B5KGB7_TAKRU
MSGPPPQRRQANVGSMVLMPQENECLFNCLGRKCITLSSAVVQVFTADRNSSWNKRCCGVACLVKDNPQRSYFIRVFDIKEKKVTFEQELYSNFSIYLSKPYFMTFAGDTCQVGLNFASEEETKRFRSHVTELLDRRQRKSEKKRDPLNGPSLPMATVDIKNPEISNVHRYNNSQMNNIVHSSFPKREKKNKGGKKKRLTKADIGTPSNFQWQHNAEIISHRVAPQLNNLDPELKNLFDVCGINEAQLKDKETSKVIYDFIEKNGGVEAVKNEFRRQGETPPPSRPLLLLPAAAPPRHPRPPPGHPSPHLLPRPRPVPVYPLRHRPPHPAGAPSRPPLYQAMPRFPSRLRLPLPLQFHPVAAHLLLPHRLLHLHPALLPPRLHPPRTLTGGDAGPPPKSALLSQIREGTQLKKVEQSERPVSSTGRDALLDQIRRGIQLKTVNDAVDSASPTAAPSSGIVGALMEVMQKRSKAIHSSGTDFIEFILTYSDDPSLSLIFS